MLQVPETSALTLCTIILHFKIISAFGFKIHPSQETALGRKRTSGGEARKPIWEWEELGAGISLSACCILRCLAGVAGPVAVCLRHWFALLACGDISESGCDHNWGGSSC